MNQLLRDIVVVIFSFAKKHFVAMLLKFQIIVLQHITLIFTNLHQQFINILLILPVCVFLLSL